MAVLPFSENEVDGLRAESPGVSGRLHLDNCGSSLMPEPVLNAIRSHLAREEKVGGYVAQEQQSVACDQVYVSLSRLMGGDAKNFALTSSAVDAWNKAFYSIPFEAGDNIVTAYNEYCSNYVAFLQQAKRFDLEVRVARQGSSGGLDLEHLESLIDGKTRVVAIAAVPSSSGQVNPVSDVGRITKAKGIYYLLDACQAVGQLPVRVDEIGCDMLTGTSRKFLRGPRGIGFLYASDRVLNDLEPAMLSNQAAAWVADNRYELRADARRFEDWERSVCNQLGFGAAVDYLLSIDPARAFATTQARAAELRQKLYGLDHVIPACPADASAAIITFNVEGIAAADVKARLDAQVIGVQVASVVHTRLDLAPRGIETAVRVSPHYYNSSEDIERFLAAVDALPA